MAGKENLAFIETEKPRENCAVVGVFSRESDIANIAFNGLVELNHRGQEGSGITLANGWRFETIKDSGLTTIVFGLKHPLPLLENASIAIGHNRYSTSGSSHDLQPFVEDGIAIAHNGNLTNVRYLREQFNLPEEIDGAKSDSRVALAVINRMKGSKQNRIISGLKQFEGSYSFVFATDDALIATRDPLGFRPLSLGRLKNGSGYVVASETAAFDAMESTYERDIFPGETVVINDRGITTIALDQRSEIAQCIFELIYFSRIDSKVFGIPVVDFRARQGEILAKHIPDVDIVMSVPRSGIGATEGVALSEEVIERGIVHKEGLYTNPYRSAVKGARTFILPNGRNKAAAKKYSANRYVLEGKRVCIVDDSIVRGSMSRVVEKLREAGASEVHALIASPPLKHPCRFGIDMATYEELLANRIPDLEERRKCLGLDSLYYMTFSETMEAVVGNKVDIEDETVFEKNDFCGACFTGRYPISTEGAIPKEEVEPLELEKAPA